MKQSEKARKYVNDDMTESILNLYRLLRYLKLNSAFTLIGGRTLSTKPVMTFVTKMRNRRKK